MVLDPEEMAELLDENVLERAISEEMPELTLSEEEKGDLSSYFMPINGMENTICQALTGVRYRLENKKEFCKWQYHHPGRCRQWKDHVGIQLDQGIAD